MSIELIPTAQIHSALLSGMHTICFAEPWSQEAFSQSLGQLDTAGVIAVAGDSLIPSLKDSGPAGMVLWRIVADEAEILTIAVLPPWRRTGLGHALLKAAMDVFTQAEVSVVFLEVAANNEAAQALYRKNGFVQVGLRKNYYSAGDALVMRKDLVP